MRKLTDDAEKESPVFKKSKEDQPLSYDPSLVEKKKEKKNDSLFGDDEKPSAKEVKKGGKEADDEGSFDELLGELDIEKDSPKRLDDNVIDDDHESVLSKKEDPKNTIAAAAEPEIKKTEKIICLTNQPVDDNEFSYFKKDKPKDPVAPKVQKIEEDINLFGAQSKKTLESGLPQNKEEDDFDFEF